jgi:hypothetical protein
MELDHIRLEIEHMRMQVSRQRREILRLRRWGIPSASAEAVLERMQAKVDGLVETRSAEARGEAGRAYLLVREADSRDTRPPQDVMDNLRRFPAPWVMEEDQHGFRVRRQWIPNLLRHPPGRPTRSSLPVCGELPVAGRGEAYIRPDRPPSWR